MWKLLESGLLSAQLGARRLWGVKRPRLARLCGALLVLVVCCGCPMSLNPSDDSDLPFLDESGNSSFDSATALPISTTDVLEFEGRIDTSADLDLYELGILSPGDELFIDAQPVDSNVDLVAAVFDSREYLHIYNDDREPDSSNLNPLIDFVVRGEEDTYFLGITTFSGSRATGAYRVTVRITRDVGVPDPRAQIVYLDWDGGQNIVVENVGTYNLGPFDAGDLGPYGDRTEEMKDRVEAIVADRYSGYDLIVLNSDDHNEPAVAHTTVYFGGSHTQALAISQQIDSMNADAADNAIIFTESYREAFVSAPPFEQMAQALGNTVAHEIGHLLGLVHTADCESLMDATCSNRSILLAQQFKTAVLDPAVFPVGSQAAREILEWVLGFVGL